jgi:succinate dehydrogenase / fumarate reductase membrane anchor subunit
MSMKTELRKVRGLGAAHDGTQHFWMQRVTAVANLPLVIYLLYFIIAHLGASREAVVASVKNPFSAVALVLAMISICWHMKLGLQMVIEDYVHGTATKLVALLANAFFAYGLAGLGIFAILKMNLGV